MCISVDFTLINPPLTITSGWVEAMHGHCALVNTSGKFQLYTISADGVQLEWERQRPATAKGILYGAELRANEMLLQGWQCAVNVYRLTDLSLIRSLLPPPNTNCYLIGVLTRGAAVYDEFVMDGELKGQWLEGEHWEEEHHLHVARFHGCDDHVTVAVPGRLRRWRDISVCGNIVPVPWAARFAVISGGSKMLRIFQENGECPRANDSKLIQNITIKINVALVMTYVL